jgi:hypothetical protein
MNLIKHYKQNHQWFTKMSKSYMKGTSRIQYYFQYPFAYVKFMIRAMRDVRQWELRNTNSDKDSHSSNKTI